MSKLAELAAAMRKARDAVTPESLAVSSKHAIFLGTYDDTQYVPMLKGMFGAYSTWVCTDKIETLSHLDMYCKKRGATKVISTSTVILSKLLEKIGSFGSKPALSNYAGSFFTYNGIEIVFIAPLKQLSTTTTGKFLVQRFISKLTASETWAEASKFSFDVLTPRNIEEKYYEFQSAFAIAVDIETLKQNLAIRCIGYTAVFVCSLGRITTSSVVLPIDSSWALIWMRKFNTLPAQKIFQNGKYDCAYLLRYNAPVTNWLWDTAHFMHSWYAELPKDLAFQNAYFLREVIYWKDLAETQDLYEYYKYNAMDTWATANVWIQQILTAPDWAKHNYFLEFPLVYPCLLAEMTGLKRDSERMKEVRGQLDVKEATALNRLQRMVGSNNFNPGSPVQVKLLLKILGCSDLDSSDEKSLKKAQLRHPLNNLILEIVLDIRGWRKLCSTYLRLDSDADKGKDNGSKEFLGRILYSLNPHGTETGRLASREHAFWCGLQIQNIPRGIEVKYTIRCESGFYLGECDLEQAESRDTANIAGDESLIRAVSGTKDFHSVNASAFFGVPYESIYDDFLGKTKDKKLRDLAKRVNHGANYNMGPGVLVDTMGLDKIWEAGRLLGLPYTDPKKIAEHLLGTFHRTYPRIRDGYYASVIKEIGNSGRLTSRAFHHTNYNLSHYTDKTYIERGDWTRRCFGQPDKNKSDLNSYVAHCPQSLNSRTLNEAFLEVFYKIAIPNPLTFRLHAQVHDSILFSYKEGYEHHAEEVRKLMEIPVTVRDVSGTYRTFTVPAALKLGMKDRNTGEFKRATYWSETE